MKNILEEGNVLSVRRCCQLHVECSGAGGGYRDCWRGKSGTEKRYCLEEEGGRNL